MVEAAGRLAAGDRSRGWPGDSAATAASAASAPPSAPHWRGHSPRDHRHLTFLKCVYYSGSDWGICLHFSRFYGATAAPSQNRRSSPRR